MPIDPELVSRVADVTGAVDGAPWLGAGVARLFAGIGLDSPAVENAPAAVFSVDLTGCIRTWNRAAEELFGWRADEVLGRTVPFLDTQTLAAAIEQYGDAIEERSFEGLEFTSHHRDGHRLHIVASVTLVRDERGEPAAAVTFATDITTKREAALAIEKAHHKWRHLLMNISDTVTILDADGHVRESTGQPGDLDGEAFDAWIGEQGIELLHPDDLEPAILAWDDLVRRSGAERREVLRSRQPDGHYELIEFTGVSLLDDPVINGVVVTTRNVTQERRTEALLAAEARVLELIARDAPLDETLPEAIRLVEEHSGGTSCLLRLRPGADRFHVAVAGSTPPELLDVFTGTPLTYSPTGVPVDLRHPVTIADADLDDRFAPFAEMFAALGARSGWSVPIIETRTEVLLGVIITTHPEPRVPDEHGRQVAEAASHLAAIAIERDRWQQELSHQARHHQLTGLPNRAQIVETLEAALDRVRSGDRSLAVMFVDLDRFKVVNDSLGHAAGDRLLVRFGGRLRNLVRPGDFVGHFGADEFVVVLEDVTGPDDVAFIGHRIDLALGEPFALDEGEIFLSASIGVALSEHGEEDAETLLRQADAARNRAKDLGRDRLEIFDHEMRSRALEQLQIDRDLRGAVERDELELHFQPKIDVRTGRIVGAEALLRWHHPDHGLLLPERFLAVAEEHGHILRIGRWVLDRAVASARAWADRHPSPGGFLLGVNLSGRQLGGPAIVDQVAAVLDAHRWPAEQLVLELTESTLIDRRETTLSVLTQLKALGVRLALDDFGTGFSSLNYLHRFPVDIVKLDRAFITNVGTGGEGSPVAAAVLQMAHALGLQTAAEGVETAAQLDGLRALDCDLAQGFLFSEALPAAAFEALLDADHAW